MCAFFHIIRYILKKQGSEKMAILTIKDLDFSYHSPQGETKALTDINLTVNEGEFISIVGPSGCGKSTFLRSLNLLEEPTGGKILFEGTDITDPKVDINRHRQKIGMVFQQTM